MTNPDLPSHLLDVAFATTLTFLILRRLLHLWRERFLRQYRFPAARTRLARHYPGYTREQWDEVFEGLRDWFLIAQRARRRPLAMPSQAVDAAWHEFILFTRDYHAFCRGALGRYLHHVPAEAMQTKTVAQEGIRRAWRLSCGLERLSPRRPTHLPRLFALDASLAFPGGFHYALDCFADANAQYCAGGIGCTSGCGGGCGDGDGGCGGGCGGD